MDHSSRVRQAFAQQAESFASAPAVTQEDLTGRIRVALAPARGGRMLDLACGPGIVAAALSPDASEVVAFDLTPEMLEKARERCKSLGLENLRFERGDAERLPFPDGAFAAVVTRLSIHHFERPATVLAEVARVLRPGGIAVIADVVSSEDPREADLHNALEILRDPSHVRMRPPSELRALVRGAGLALLSEDAWRMDREFGEWARIANDPQRTGPLRTVMTRLAEAGLTAGIGLRTEGDHLVFFHEWLLIEGEKKGAGSPG